MLLRVLFELSTAAIFRGAEACLRPQYHAPYPLPAPDCSYIFIPPSELMKGVDDYLFDLEQKKAIVNLCRGCYNI